MADFTVDLTNFEEGLWECYKRFIERVRNLIAVRYSHNHPVTPLEVNPPNQFFDVLLGTNNHNIRVRFRRDNLYLIGFQMHGSNQWLELRYLLNDPNRPRVRYNPLHRIPDDQTQITQWLNFGDTYDLLIYAGGVTALSDIHGGRQEFINAIDSLATPANDRTRARSLLVLVVMISESIRFTRITTHFGTEATTRTPIPDWIVNYVHGWNDLSAALLRTDWDNFGNVFQLPPINNFENIGTVAEALAIIGTMKGCDWPRRHRRAADDKEDNINGAGRPLVELFSVKIDNIHGNQHTIGDIYGTIKVSDGLGHEYMYNQKPNGSESVHTRGTILLNGPPRCISAYDNFTIDVTLMCKNGLSEDDEISKGQIKCEVTYLNSNAYDKLLFQEIKGRFGSATLCYAILRGAVVATVEFTLISKNGKPTDVYGLLTSHNVDLNSESVLFQKAAEKFVNVKPDELIPLSRSVVAVPLSSNFIVRADLKGANIFASDDKIAKGTATFTPQLFGTNEQSISGNNNNQIRVKVSWSWYV